jgi:hypothetical protein
MRSIGILISLLFAIAGIAMGQGVITTVAGAPFASCGPLGDGGPATSAQLCGAESTAVDASGNIYFYDYGNARIREITPSGMITTIAGNGVHGTSGDGGPALSASLGSIFQLAVDPSGQRLCFGDSSASKIRCVFLATRTIQGYGTGAYGYGGLGDGADVANATFNDPVGVAFDDVGNLYVSDFQICVCGAWMLPLLRHMRDPDRATAVRRSETVAPLQERIYTNREDFSTGTAHCISRTAAMTGCGAWIRPRES